MQSYGTSLGEIMKLLNYTSIFAGVGLHEQHMLADKCQIIRCNSNEIVIEQGEVGDTLYIIMNGSVEVSVKTPYEVKDAWPFFIQETYLVKSPF